MKRRPPTVCPRPAEINQKEDKKKQKSQGSAREEKSSTLQRSKTLINLLFRGGRKRDTSRGRSKSPFKGRPGLQVTTQNRLGENRLVELVKTTQIYKPEGSVTKPQTNKLISYR